MSDLAAEIDRLTEPPSTGCGCSACLAAADRQSEDAIDGARSPMLEALSDSQLQVLLDLVQEEGLARGWRSWWWE